MKAMGNMLLLHCLLVLALALTVKASDAYVNSLINSGSMSRFGRNLDIFSNNGEKKNIPKNCGHNEQLDPTSVILSLTECNINVIESNKFSNLPSLTVLFLDKNTLSNTIFLQDLPSNILYVSAVSNNINAISPGNFQHLTGFNILNLNFNKIKELTGNTLMKFSSLKRLELGHNLIDTIKPEFFLELEDLEYLELSYNSLASLDKDTFTYLRNIKHILLNNNNLKEVQTNVFGKAPKKLVDIMLYNNSLIDNRPDDSTTVTVILKQFLDAIVGNQCSSIDLCIAPECKTIDVCY